MTDLLNFSRLINEEKKNVFLASARLAAAKITQPYSPVIWTTAFTASRKCKKQCWNGRKRLVVSTSWRDSWLMSDKLK